MANIELALRNIQPKVSQSMNNRLLAPFTKAEIERAINEMFPITAPGLDGYPTLFYHKYWNIVVLGLNPKRNENLPDHLLRFN